MMMMGIANISLFQQHLYFDMESVSSGADQNRFYSVLVYLKRGGIVLDTYFANFNVLIRRMNAKF